MPTLFMSGYTGTGPVAARTVLRKPIRRKELLAAVRETLDERTKDGAPSASDGRLGGHR